MNAGDKFHIKDRDNWSEIIADEHEVIEDTGKDLLARNCVTGEESTILYHQVTDWPRCAYCGIPRRSDELKEGTITFQNSRSEYDNWKRRMVNKRFVDRKTSLYCKDKPCHGHDQMGHEG
jgi:hypothetical protein